MRTPRPGSRRSPPVKSLDKALRILALFTPETPHLTLAEICRRLMINRSVVYRLVISLEAHGFLERGDGGLYRVGKRAYELGSLYVYGNPLVERARPVLLDLVRRTGWTAQLSVLDGTEMLVLATRESPAMVRAVADVGVRMPMHATAAGKAALAHLPDATVACIIAETRLPAFTPRTITTPAALQEELQKVRDNGYAVHDEEWTEGLYALGAPLHDQEGVRGAVVIAAPTSLLPSSDLDLLVSATKGAAERLSTFQARSSAHVSATSRFS